MGRLSHCCRQSLWSESVEFFLGRCLGRRPYHQVAETPIIGPICTSSKPGSRIRNTLTSSITGTIHPANVVTETAIISTSHTYTLATNRIVYTRAATRVAITILSTSAFAGAAHIGARCAFARSSCGRIDTCASVLIAISVT